MTFLAIEQLSKRYGPVTALDGVTLKVPVGSRTAIVGPSGSGKTTLLRLVAGFDAPDEGRLTLNGELLADRQWSVPAHRRGIGIVAQDGALFPHLTVKENIGFGLATTVPRRDERILGLMDTVDLGRNMLNRRPHELSGGQQQRVALARALARQPKLMLFDEPFSALDAGLREGVRTSVAEVLKAEGITAVLVTHDQAEALSFADQVAVLRGGRLIQDGSPRDLYLSPRDPETAVFLGEAIILSARLDGAWADCALGRIAISRPCSGTGKIMLRPEQLRMIATSPDDDDMEQDPCHGQIIAIDFAGAFSTVTIELLRRRSELPIDAGSSQTLTIKMSSVDLLPAGSRVLIETRGPAHVLSASSNDQYT